MFLSHIRNNIRSSVDYIAFTGLLVIFQGQDNLIRLEEKGLNSSVDRRNIASFNDCQLTMIDSETSVRVKSSYQ